MDASDRNISRFVLVDDTAVRPDGDFSRAAHHHPMFRAMEVLLQGEFRAWFDDDTFHLIARPQVDALIIAPGPIDPQMLTRLRAVLCFQALDQTSSPARPCGGKSTRTASAVVITTTLSNPTTVVRILSSERARLFRLS